MRSKGLLACMAAVMMSHGAQAERDPLALAGPIDAPDVGEAILSAFDRPGTPLGRSVRFRIEGFRDNLVAVSRGISPMRVQALDPTRRRRFDAVLDLTPVADSGFLFTAGFRRSPKRARWNPAALATLDIFTPKLPSPLRVRTNVARSSPMAMVGWSGSVGGDLRLSVSAGALQEHGRDLKASALTIARQQPTSGRWSRIGTVANASMRWAF